MFARGRNGKGRNDKVEGCGKRCLKGMLDSCSSVDFPGSHGEKKGADNEEGDGRPGCGMEKSNDGRVLYIFDYF